MSSIFTKIIQGEIPAYKVAEDESFLAILDAFPVKRGHVLVIPKKEVDYIFDLDQANYTGLMLFSKRVANAIKEGIECKRVSLQIIGLEVPHAHVHLIPINTMNDCNFSNEKLKLSKEEFTGIADKIAAHFQ